MRNSALGKPGTTEDKFKPKWFGPYKVRQKHTNGSYNLEELDGTEIHSRIAGKRVKLFRRRPEELSKKQDAICDDIADFLLRLDSENMAEDGTSSGLSEG